MAAPTSVNCVGLGRVQPSAESFGCQSERGERFVARMLTVVRTLRRQGRNLLDFLEASIRSALRGSRPRDCQPPERLRQLHWAQVCRIDREKDLALLKIAGSIHPGRPEPLGELPSATFRRAPSLEPGEAVHV